MDTTNESKTKLESSIYLDYNATTPLAPEVIEGISKSLVENWGNPSSSYGHGILAKTCIEKSRVQVGTMINANPQDIIFTSGGTEANNMVITSVIKNYMKNGYKNKYGLPHVITSNIEHDSIMKPLENYGSFNDQGEFMNGIELSIIPVDPSTGCLNPADVIKEIRHNTCLISIMHANNETGIIMPISQIGKEIQALNQGLSDLQPGRIQQGFPQIYFHTDAAQTIGKIHVDVQNLFVDYLTIVGHKFYGPRIGALYVKDLLLSKNSTPVSSLIHGGGQERSFRSGTENTPMIVGLGISCQLVSQNQLKYEADMKNCRSYFESKINNLIPDAKINFIETASPRLPNTISLALPEPYTGRQILGLCSGLIDASLGAACHSTNVDKPSRILVNSGLSEEVAKRTIRFSIGRTTTMKEVDLAINVLVKKLKSNE